MNFYADTPMWCMGPLWTVKTLDILVEAVDYSAKTYGTAYPVWKIRLYRHNTTFHKPAHRSETETTPADYIWDNQYTVRCYQRGEDECDNSIDY